MMKTVSLTLVFALFLTVSTAFAQLKSMVNAKTETTIQTTTLLTPEMFFDTSPGFDLFSYSISDLKKQIDLPILDKKFTEYALLFGRSIIANKNDLKSLNTFYPRTVSDYNRQARQQFFLAEPTSQQRRSLPLFNW